MKNTWVVTYMDELGLPCAYFAATITMTPERVIVVNEFDDDVMSLKTEDVLGVHKL